MHMYTIHMHMYTIHMHMYTILVLKIPGIIAEKLARNVSVYRRWAPAYNAYLPKSLKKLKTVWGKKYQGNNKYSLLEQKR